MSRESQGSWSQRRSRGPDVRFFADLEEKNNRNVDVPPHAPPATYQRWSKRRSSSHQQVSKAYDRSADRVNHSHNYPAYRDRSNSRNSDGRARFASDSNNNNKYNGTSRSRSGSIDGIRRSESDHKSFPRSSLSSEARSSIPLPPITMLTPRPRSSAASNSVRRSSPSCDRIIGGSRSPDQVWDEDENRSRDPVRPQSVARADSNTDLNDRIKRMRYSYHERSNHRSHFQAHQSNHYNEHNEQWQRGDVTSSHPRTRTNSNSSRRRLGPITGDSISPATSRKGGPLSDSGACIFSSSSTSFLCPLADESAESHTEGNIDLVHLIPEPADEGTKCPLICNPGASDTITHVSDDAASISTITSVESTTCDPADMILSQMSDEDEDRYSEDSAGGTVCSSRRSRSRSLSVRSRPSSRSRSNSRSRIYSHKRSDSTPDAVFYETSGHTARKFVTRGYKAFCDRRNAEREEETLQKQESGRNRSNSRSSPPVHIQRKNWHISRRLYDFDDYSTPDRDERINRTLYLGGLNPQMTEQEIRTLFQPYGEIKSVFVKKVDPSRNTTYGFVKMGNLTQAFRARAALNGYPLGFLKLVIRYGKTYPTSRVWLGNLPLHADSAFLYRELDRFGALVKMVHFKATGEALAEFESIPGAVEAKNGMRGVVLDSSGTVVIGRSSSLSSSRPSSASSSIPSPTPPQATLTPTLTHTLHSLTSVIPDPVPINSSLGISACAGIITDFDDHESSELMDSAASSNGQVRNSVCDNALPADSSFSRSVGEAATNTSADSISVTSDSEEDEVQLHHMPQSVTRSEADSYHNCSPPSQQPENRIKFFREMNVLTAQPMAPGRRPKAMFQSDDCSSKSLILRSPCGPKTPPLPSPRTPLTPICHSSVTISSGRRPGPEAGLQNGSKGRSLQPSQFSFEPEDLLIKSLTRLDPRLLCRSGVYRQKSILHPD